MAFSKQSAGYVLIGFSVLLVLLLIIVKVDLDERDAYLCTITHEEGLDLNQCPAHQSNTSWFLSAAFGVAFFILGIGLYIVLPLSRKDDSKEALKLKEINLSKLNDDEKKIYAFLKQHEGTCYQSDLIEEFGYYKVKVTRILDKMEQQGILERKRRGMTNLIVLK